VARACQSFSLNYDDGLHLWSHLRYCYILDQGLSLKVMKTVLVTPSALEKSIEHTKWQQSLGLTYIAACIRDISDVSIIDCEIEQDPVKTLLKEIGIDESLVVAFSVNTYTYPEALKLAEIVKNHNQDIHINFGGYHVTPLAELVLNKRPYVDSVIRGDGEIPFRQLLIALIDGRDLSGVGSLTYRKNGEIISNPKAPLPDLDSLPYPARELLPLEMLFENFKKSILYKSGKVSRMIFVNVTRGCPGRCNYCSIFNKTWRCRNPIKIVDEIEMLQRIYNADSFYLIGDNINYDSLWLVSLCNEIIDRKLNISYILTNPSVDKMSVDLIDKLDKSGCVGTSYSFESASQKMLNALDRKSNINNFGKIIDYTKRRGIEINACFVLGAPGENQRSINSTLDFINKYDFNRIAASILAPLPGSKLFNSMVAHFHDIRNNDIISLDYMKKLYVDNYCEIDYDELREVEINIEKSNTAFYVY